VIVTKTKESFLRSEIRNQILKNILQAKLAGVNFNLNKEVLHEVTVKTWLKYLGRY